MSPVFLLAGGSATFACGYDESSQLCELGPAWGDWTKTGAQLKTVTREVFGWTLRSGSADDVSLKDPFSLKPVQRIAGYKMRDFIRGGWNKDDAKSRT